MNIISENYRNLNEELHKTNEHYGTSGSGYRHLVRPLADWGRKKILDYGCGKQTLSKSLGPAYRVTDYDPCIPGLDVSPDPHSIVVCTDVMEHIEPDYLDAVLQDLLRLTEDYCFVAVALRPSTKTLADGRNSHLIVEKPEWWSEQFVKAGFTIFKAKPRERVKAMAWWILAPPSSTSGSAGTPEKSRPPKSVAQP